MWLIILSLTLRFLNCGAQEEFDYCGVNKDHILCGAEDALDVIKAKNIPYWPQKDSEREEVLDGVNKIRNFLSSGMVRRYTTQFPMASNMYELQWCDECEKAAFNAIKNCNRSEAYRPCCNCMNTGTMDLFTITQTRVIQDSRSKKFNFTTIISSIFNESEKFMKITYGCVKKVTQDCVRKDLLPMFINSRTVKIGCVFVECDAATVEDYPTDYMLCITNLDYTLDILDNPLYLPGDPCSECPEGSSCSETYTNLCKCEEIETCLIKPAPLLKAASLTEDECPTRAGVSSTVRPATVYITSKQILNDSEFIKGVAGGGANPPSPAPPPPAPTPEMITTPTPPTTTTTTSTTTAKNESGAGGGADTSGVEEDFDNVDELVVISFALIFFLIRKE